MFQLNIRSLFVACAAVAVGVLAFAPLAEAQAKKEKDTVQLKGGKAESGKVTNSDFSGLTLEIKPGQSKPIAWADVAAIDWGSAGAVGDGLDLFEKGKLDEALTALNGAKAGASKLRPVLQQELLYHLPLILQRMGKLDEAAAGYKELFEAFPKGRYLRMAGENWVNCMLAKDDLNGAEDAISKIALAAQSVQGADADVALIKARVLEAKKSYPTARASYEAAEKAATAGSTTAQDARLGKARCLVAEGNKADAGTILEDLKKNATSNVVLAGTWNVLGDMTAEEGRASKNIDKLLDALYMHLRGVVQYAPLPSDPTREYERAIAGAALDFKAMSEVDTNADRKKSYKDKFEANKAKLKKEFPNSPFLKGL